MMGFVALVFSTIFIWFLGVVVGTVIGSNVTNKSIVKDSNTYGITLINRKYYRILEIINVPNKGPKTQRGDKK